MAKTTYLMLIFLLLVFQSKAQSRFIPISGTVTNLEQEYLANMKVIILENNIALDSVYTDLLGEFTFTKELKAQNEYAIKTNCSHDRNPIIVFHQSNDTATIDLYTIQLVCITPKFEKFDDAAYFEFNSIDSFVNFNALFLKSTLDKYPGMCVEFRQAINPKESSKIVKQRMNYFAKTLKEIGCDLNRLTFLDEIIKLNKGQISIDGRSRIIALIISMDGDCK